MPSQIKASVDWAKDGNFTGTFDNVTSRLSPTARVVVEYGRDVTTPMAPVTSGSGSLTLLNGDRRYSPRNTASPLSGLIKPARPFKLERTISLPSPTTYTLGPRMHTDSQPLNPDRDAKTAGVRLVDYVADLRGKSLSTAMFQGLRAGDAVGKILDGIGWTAGRDIDPGVSYFPFWWEEGDASDALDKVLRSEGWPALAYVDGAGTFVFRDRHHRLLDAASATSQVTFRASGLEPVMGKDFSPDDGWDGIVNDAIAQVDVRVAQPYQSVWTRTSSIVVPNGGTATLVVQASDGCIDLLVPGLRPGAPSGGGAGLEEYFTTGPGGFDQTPQNAIVLASLSRTSGQSAILTLTNLGGGDEVVSNIDVWGSPVTVEHVVQCSASDATSITAYGSRGLPNSDLPWCTAYDAQRILDLIVGQRKDPLTLVTCTFKIGRTAAGPPVKSDARANAVLARGLSDRVTIVEPETQINGDFCLERIRHDLADDLDHTVTMWLEAVPATVAPAASALFTFDNNTAGRRFNSGAFG